MTVRFLRTVIGDPSATTLFVACCLIMLIIPLALPEMARSPAG